MAGLVMALGSSIAAQFTLETAKFIAWRVLMIVLIWTIVPLAIFKAFGLIMKYMVPLMLNSFTNLVSQFGGIGLSANVVSLTGVGGYIGSHLRIGEGISVLITWYVFKFVWGMLPKPMAGGYTRF